MPEAVIVATARSPIGRAFKGALKGLRPDDLTAQMVAAALAKVPALNPSDIEDLILGCGQPAGESGNNLARVVAVLSDMDYLPGTTVNRFCASSLQALRMAFHAIKSGEGDALLVAGVETASRFSRGSADWDGGNENPLFDDARVRTAQLASGSAQWSDPRQHGSLPDIYAVMGQTAENVAQLEGVTREEQDAYALLSQNRAEKAIAEGFWERDITPVRLPDGTLVAADDCPRPGTTADALASLKPAFRPDGTVTAGNACPLNDGAAAVVVMSDVKASALGITPLARIVSTGVSALSPEIMGLGPVEASQRALTRAGLTVDDIDLVEVNEAFAAQVIPSARRLGIDEDKLNVNGGAIAIGHPFGMTGARIATTLIHSLQERDLRFGLETMCVGGGQGMAMVFERLS
ncbi:acetyl-CoA C-acetyltransferase [Micromonospora globispora]|uniref:acetyl-CoA C-acetyltransferase n=1 Tax=Micromonospora globispora TaxID=1450148 RepID=UPI000D6F5393|nr:acetyl-CoA C-acetyltransferase [Micromonospora globispora]PWU55478.1 acetyl-CoA C-acetyltransferase [Micromonospora globispora]RQW98006.1 acetyl-CoA C-acetyltransferase [Micromonospora globispora]